MPDSLTVGHLALTYDGSVLKIHNTLRHSIVGMRPEELELLVELLDGVSWERRGATRVPVVNCPSLGVLLELTDRMFHVVPIDLSTSGIQVSWPRDTFPKVCVNDHMQITITYRDQEASCAGIVRRTDVNTLGISFIDDDGSDNASLRRLVDNLETDWLGQRILGKCAS
jgi:hypothetical protein